MQRLELVRFHFFEGKATRHPLASPQQSFRQSFYFFATWRGIHDLFYVRVLPYFERPIGQKDTWLAGINLLRENDSSRNEVMHALQRFRFFRDDVRRGAFQERRSFSVSDRRAGDARTA